MTRSLTAPLALCFALLAGCAAAPLGAGLLVHPETDVDGVGIVKYRVGGYDTAKSQMLMACPNSAAGRQKTIPRKRSEPRNSDVEILHKQIDEATIEEGTASVTPDSAGAKYGSAPVSIVELKFRFVERTEPGRFGRVRVPKNAAADATTTAAEGPKSIE